MENFAILLESHRLAAGKSQAELARAARISPSYLNRMERGDRPPPSREVVIQIAKSLCLKSSATDDLLLAGGYAPTTSAAPAVNHPVLGLAADLLQDERLPETEIDLLARQIELTRRRWQTETVRIGQETV